VLKKNKERYVSKLKVWKLRKSNKDKNPQVARNTISKGKWKD